MLRSVKLNYSYAGFFHVVKKLRGLLAYICAGLWEYVVIVKFWF